MSSEFLFSTTNGKNFCVITFREGFNFKKFFFSSNFKMFAAQNKKSCRKWRVICLKKNFGLSLFSSTRKFYRIICRYLLISRFVDLLAGSARVRLTGNSIGAKSYSRNICPWNVCGLILVSLWLT